MNDDQPTIWPDVAVSELIDIGIGFGFGRFEYQPTTRMLSLFKKDIRVNIYYTRGTIGTCVTHPTKGKTQLFRRNVTTMKELQKILTNPRTHTQKGYYKK